MSCKSRGGAGGPAVGDGGRDEGEDWESGRGRYWEGMGNGMKEEKKSGT